MQSLFEELKKATRTIGPGYSPLRRYLVYEIYRYLCGRSDKPAICDFLSGLESGWYIYHLERMVVPFRALRKVEVPIPESKEEAFFQLRSLDEEDFTLNESLYRGVIMETVSLEQYPALSDAGQFGMSCPIFAESGIEILVDAKTEWIHTGTPRKEIVIFALPDSSAGRYHAVLIARKSFADRFLPLDDTEDIFFALYEYLHYSSLDFQSFVDDERLIHEFALELSHAASVLSAVPNSMQIEMSDFEMRLRGKWDLFHGSTMLVNHYFFHVAGRLGYMQWPRKTARKSSGESSREDLTCWDTFPMLNELQFLSQLAEKHGASIVGWAAERKINSPT